MNISTKAGEIIERAQGVLTTAELGYVNLTSDDPECNLPGLMNVAAFGRAVTNVLQNLRSIVDNFDGWYKFKQVEMKQDPICRHFYKIRSEILKKGKLNTSSITTGSFGVDDLPSFADPPPVPRGSNIVFFFGDRIGGDGWEIVTPDGTALKYYVRVPGDLARTELLFMDDALDKEIQDTPVIDLARHYLDYLAELIAEARQTFCEES